MRSAADVASGLGLDASGRIRLTQGPHTVELGPGDYLLWDAKIPHDAECIGDEPAVLLLIGHRTEGTEASRPEG
jgi:quercetin dioxygenase-like cupin family protein